MYASMLMRSESGTEAHSIFDNTLGENGLDAWMGYVQRLGPASAHTNLKQVIRIFKPPKGKVDHISSLIEAWGETARRHDEKNGRQALTDDTQRATMMEMCPSELGRDNTFSSGRFDTYPKVKAATREAQLRHKSVAMEFDELAGSSEDANEGECEDVRAVRRANGQARSKAKESQRDPRGVMASRQTSRAARGRITEGGGRRIPMTSRPTAMHGTRAARQCTARGPEEKALTKNTVVPGRTMKLCGSRRAARPRFCLELRGLEEKSGRKLCWGQPDAILSGDLRPGRIDPESPSIRRVCAWTTPQGATTRWANSKEGHSEDSTLTPPSLTRARGPGQRQGSHLPDLA